jgi:hypothetical protein
MPRRILAVLTILATGGALPAAPTALEEKVESVLREMTLEEKVKMCLGASNSGFAGVERLDLAGAGSISIVRMPNRVWWHRPRLAAVPQP